MSTDFDAPSTPGVNDDGASSTDTPITAQTTVMIRMIGRFEFCVDGHPHRFADCRKSRSLLCILLLAEGRPVPVDRLIDLLWPEAPLNRARNAVHVAISRLRRVLRQFDVAHLVRQHGDCYELDPGPLWVDIWQFRRLLDSAGRSRDPASSIVALEACAMLGGNDELLSDEPYAEWIQRDRDNLRSDVMHCHRLLASAYLSTGNTQACVWTARTALRLDPADEELSRTLIHAYLLLGQRNLAASEYQRLVRVLWNDLGIRPSEATSRAIEELSGGRHTADPNVGWM